MLDNVCHSYFEAVWLQVYEQGRVLLILISLLPFFQPPHGRSSYYQNEEHKLLFTGEWRREDGRKTNKSAVARVMD